MKNVQFPLRIKKERIYSDRIVELGGGVIKYFKKKNPKEIRFQANLSDLVFYEKYRNKLSQYKLVLTSKTNSFPLIKVRPTSRSDINPLLNFKTQLENFINSEKIAKSKNEEIIVRVNREEKVSICTEGNLKTCKFESSSNRFYTTTRSSNIPPNLNFKSLCESTINNFSDFKEENNIDINDIYSQFLKSEYTIFKSKNDIEIMSTDNELLYKKLIKSEDNFNEISENFEKTFLTQNYSHYILNIILILFSVIFMLYYLYLQKFIPILTVVIIYSYLNFELNAQFSSKVENSINFFNFFNFFNFLKFDKFVKFNFPLKANYKEDLHVKSETIVNINIFSLTNYLIFKNCSEKSNTATEFKFYVNYAEKVIIITEYEFLNIVNIYCLKSNDNSHFTKTKLTFFSLLKSNNPNSYAKSLVSKLKNFINFVNFEMDNTIYFESDNIHSLDLQTIEKLTTNNEAESHLQQKSSHYHKIKESALSNSSNNIILPSQENIYIVTENDLKIKNTSRESFEANFLNQSMISQSISHFIQKETCLIENIQKQVDDFLFGKSNKQIEELIITDDSLNDVLMNLNFVNLSDPQTAKTNSFIKQYCKQNKIYKAKIILDCDRSFIIDYVRNVENQVKFNKFLKDVVILKESVYNELNFCIQYHLYDYRMFNKMRDFILLETYREIPVSLIFLTF